MRISNDKNNILVHPPDGAVILTKHRRQRLRGISGVGDTEKNALAVYYTDTKWPCNRNCFSTPVYYIIFIVIYRSYYIYNIILYDVNAPAVAAEYDAHIHPHVMGSVATIKAVKRTGVVLTFYYYYYYFFFVPWKCSLSFGKGHYRRIPPGFGKGEQKPTLLYIVVIMANFGYLYVIIVRIIIRNKIIYYYYYRYV